MLKLSELQLVSSHKALNDIPEGKVLINTINAHSYNVAQKDDIFAQALAGGDYLIPDGASVVKACRWLKGKSQPEERIAGWDLFEFEMKRLQERSEKLKVKSEKCEEESEKLKVMFMGSSERVLQLIRERAAKDYPLLEVVAYSPPYKPEFTADDNAAIISAINAANPDLLWIGMTAPKQEKWTFQHWPQLNVHCHVGTIGAVFDFYAGTARRAPLWWQRHSLEWLYRLLREPRRMWRRYVVGNPLFLWNVFSEKF
ncbi:MAG: WecB/TagA/CpsF family glycosyltransferase [Prevotella sp.]|nr:WecB/TagA/CpsF family glycosyltransferase [Prevotella sp.]